MPRRRCAQSTARVWPHTKRSAGAYLFESRWRSRAAYRRDRVSGPVRPARLSQGTCVVAQAVADTGSTLGSTLVHARQGEGGTAHGAARNRGCEVMLIEPLARPDWDEAVPSRKGPVGSGKCGGGRALRTDQPELAPFNNAARHSPKVGTQMVWPLRSGRIAGDLKPG